MKEPRLAQKIGGAVFGLLFGFIVSNAVRAGAGFIFERTEVLGLPFWGGHYITLVIGQLVGFWVGGFVAGCIAKDHGSYWGIVSTLPRVVIWIYLIGHEMGYGDFYWWTGDWIVAILLVAAPPPLAYHAGKIGQETRIENEEFFETRKGTLLGVKWYHWLWLFFPIYITGLLATISVYQMIGFFFLITKSFFWFLMIGTWVEAVIGGGLYLLGRSMYETYNLLAFGYQRGLRNTTVAKYITLWLIGSYLGVSLLQFVAGWILAKF